MTHTAVETTQIEISDSTIELSQGQVNHVNHVNRGIAKGLADMKAGRCLSDPEEIAKDIQRRIEANRKTYLASLK
jgi:hypothetical protein